MSATGTYRLPVLLRLPVPFHGRGSGLEGEPRSFPSLHFPRLEPLKSEAVRMPFAVPGRQTVTHACSASSKYRSVIRHPFKAVEAIASSDAALYKVRSESESKPLMVSASGCCLTLRSLSPEVQRGHAAPRHQSLERLTLSLVAQPHNLTSRIRFAMRRCTAKMPAPLCMSLMSSPMFGGIRYGRPALWAKYSPAPSPPN